MKTQNLSIYLINIDTRLDKYLRIESQLSKLGYAFKKISAKTPENTSLFNLDFCPPPTVQANWLSHLEVYKNLIKSKKNFCLVLEDDCIFSNRFGKLLETIETFETLDFDILQIGYLKQDNTVSQKNVFVATIRLKIYRNVLKITKFFNKFLNAEDSFNYVSKRILKLESLVIKSKELKSRHLIKEEFLSGTHAYIISRSFAHKILNYNKPITMGADLALQMLSISGNWKIYRTAYSFAKQDDVKADIGDHRSLPQDFSSQLLKDFN